MRSSSCLTPGLALALIYVDADIKCFSMYHVDKWGIGKVVDMALDHVNKERSRPIHLSFDVDALDPTVAPSTGTAVRTSLPPPPQKNRFLYFSRSYPPSSPVLRSVEA